MGVDGEHRHLVTSGKTPASGRRGHFRMPLRTPAVRVVPPVRGFALAAAVCVAIPAAYADGHGEIAVECRFSFGLSAIYLFNRSEARVRRVDLLQSRKGRVQATVAEYRFTFLEHDSAYRIDVVIDRATGNARRVFGARENMERMPERESRLVYEAGQCNAQHAELR